MVMVKILVSLVALTVGTLLINKWFRKTMKNGELYSEVNVPVFDTPVVSLSTSRRRRRNERRKVTPIMKRKTGKGRHK